MRAPPPAWRHTRNPSTDPLKQLRSERCTKFGVSVAAPDNGELVDRCTPHGLPVATSFTSNRCTHRWSVRTTWKSTMYVGVLLATAVLLNSVPCTRATAAGYTPIEVTLPDDVSGVRIFSDRELSKHDGSNVRIFGSFRLYSERVDYAFLGLKTICTLYLY